MRFLSVLFLILAAACVLPSCSPNFMSFMKAESVPVCSEDYGVVCRPPSRVGVEWVRKNVCPEKTELQYRSCYIPVGEQYVYVRFP